MEIIKCTLSDWDRVTDFYNNVVDYLISTINYPRWVRDGYPSRKSVKRAIDRGDQFACIDDGKVVGGFILNDDPMGDYGVGDWEKDLNTGEFLIIHTLATAPDTYKKGIGRFMIEFCIDYAKEKGYKALRLDVVPGNEPAIKLYKKLGFTFAGEKDLGKNLEAIPTFELYELNF